MEVRRDVACRHLKRRIRLRRVRRVLVAPEHAAGRAGRYGRHLHFGRHGCHYGRNRTLALGTLEAAVNAQPL